MGKVSFSARSRRDLMQIWRWIAVSSGVTRADAIIARIEQRVSILGSHAAAGPARPDIHPKARLLVVERWLVLYSSSGDQVKIERIIDSSRDVSRKIFD
ncbi:type II toxin-antitoxin system RelE/ParE family toxin [Rhizobium sp.]